MKLLFIDVVETWIYSINKTLAVTPLALGYLAKISEDLGCETEFLRMFLPKFTDNDVIIKKQNQDIRLSTIQDVFSKDTQSFKEYLLKHTPDVLCFSPLTYNYDSNVRIKNFAKKILPNIKTCVGNVHVSALPDKGIADGFDYVFVSSALRTFKLVIKSLLNKDGIVKPGSILRPEYKMEGFDTLGTLSNKFFTVDKPTFDNKIGYTYFSNGCNYKCKFCCIPNKYGGWEHRSISATVDEITQQRNMFKSNAFFVFDADFLMNAKAINNLLALYDILDALGLDTKFSVQTRCETIVRLAKEQPLVFDRICSRIDRMLFGIEVLDNKALDFYNKAAAAENSVKAVDLMKERNIFVVGYFIIGAPTDTYDTLERIFEFVQEKEIAQAVSILTPYPETELYYYYKKRGEILSEDWNLYDNRHLVVKHDNLTEEGILERIDNFFDSLRVKKFLVKETSNLYERWYKR